MPVITTQEKTNYDDAHTHSQGTHAPSDAEANTVDIDVVNVFTAAQRGQIHVLTYAPLTLVDFALSNRYSVVVTGDTEIDNPTNLVAGQSGTIFVEQDSTGGRLVTWDTYFSKLGTFDEDISANKINIYAYEVYSSTKIILSHVGGF